MEEERKKVDVELVKIRVDLEQFHDCSGCPYLRRIKMGECIVHCPICDTQLLPNKEQQYGIKRLE